MLPSWESLISGTDQFVDKYGFKYEKNNEKALLQYVCQQLSIFFDNQPCFFEDKYWRDKIRQWRKSFFLTVSIIQLSWPQKINCYLDLQKEMKNVMRNGLPTRYRGKIWQILINNKIKDVKQEKGPNYYSFLCNLARNSSV